MNEIVIYDDYAEMIIYNKQGNEKCRTLIDLDDIEKVKDYRWSFKGYVGKGYVKNEKNKLFLHKFIMNAPKGVVVDHINHNKLDNRKCNLRICTHSQNNMNRVKQSNNTSGYTGVYWSKEHSKWHAQIECNKKRIHLGYYNDIEDAVKARKQAEIEYFGEYRNNKC